MTFFRSGLRQLLRLLARYPRVKRAIVDVVYRLPSVDRHLRDMAHKVTHPEARLDVDPARMPSGSQRSLDRIRKRMKK
jgi:hypothetical protein